MEVTVLLLIIFVVVTIVVGSVTAMGATRRIDRERRQFRIAILPVATENPRYWVLGLVPGLLLSLVFIGGALTLPPALVMLLGVLSGVLALIPAYFPVLIGVSGLLYLLLPHEVSRTLGGVPSIATWGANFGLVVGAILLVTALGNRLLPYHSAPDLMKRHGRTWVQYLVHQRIWLPIIMPIPADMVAHLGWWPHVSVAGINVALTLLPAFMGLGIRHRQPSATGILRRDTLAVGLVAIVSLVLGVLGRVGVLAPQMVVVMVAEVSMFGSLLSLMARYERPAIAAAAGGVRVVAVLDHTPAAKMQLQRGDTILQCNGQAVPTNADLYAATQNLGTFCRLRVRGFDGQIRLAETAIYKGTPHMLGIITFPEGE